jgi:enoyl-CoA hydratase/carnithine racemase
VPTREELDAAVGELTARLAQGGADALRATKGLLNEIDGSREAELVRKGARLSADVLSTPEAQARLRAKLKA